jgi:hypothetical protein
LIYNASFIFDAIVVNFCTMTSAADTEQTNETQGDKGSDDSQDDDRKSTIFDDAPRLLAILT